MLKTFCFVFLLAAFSSCKKDDSINGALSGKWHLDKKVVADVGYGTPVFHETKGAKNEFWEFGNNDKFQFYPKTDLNSDHRYIMRASDSFTIFYGASGRFWADFKIKSHSSHFMILYKYQNISNAEIGYFYFSRLF